MLNALFNRMRRLAPFATGDSALIDVRRVAPNERTARRS
jgi:hypothetical protein